MYEANLPKVRTRQEHRLPAGKTTENKIINL